LVLAIAIHGPVPGVELFKFFCTCFAHPPRPAVSLCHLLIDTLGIHAASN
jgi:hypothetical protein